ncbi:Na+/H+ antiporter NhaA [Pseudodesulfovibrio sp. zrk46]|uniref:Na+/H+ antiporter NhaA n=1 Tax=Pseudodesulfovibrio sp. zrk46 TaxID=2725288 RepID=UPI001448DF7E|nr:Na+/H+ antiporter NhaA [Pseudodesulfovibrio sp. zrk46]QJB55600.1 Na+/H+ antiporter NhaA [Pseudodesulfovibrio sp. zrk46]
MAIRNVITCGLEPIDQVLMPFQHFFKSKSTGGIILIISAVVALIWANSTWAASYFSLWETKFTVGYGELALSKPLLLWVNDGLMAMFFFVVGLEIKREFMVGELSTRRQAVLPIFAAIGGMVVPAGIYAIFNINGVGAHGWGIPMATDIAFALGILALLGDRVPYQLKIFLTAVAIVDDIGAVLVIALFYTSEIAGMMLLLAAALLVVAYIGNKAGIRTPVFYAIIGLIVWVAVLKSGVHSTVAGVLMAFTIPARTTCDAEAFTTNASNLLKEYESAITPGSSVLTNSTMHSALLSMQRIATRAQTPLQRLEHGMAPLVDYLIMPIFALANAGVALGGSMAGAVDTSMISVGVALGLFLGKPIGIVLAVILLVRISGGWPGGMTLRHFIGAGLLGGIGFTMSLFIAALAFEDQAMLNAAKASILAASTLAGVAGYLVLKSLPLPEDS